MAWGSGSLQGSRGRRCRVSDFSVFVLRQLQFRNPRPTRLSPLTWRMLGHDWFARSSCLSRIGCGRCLFSGLPPALPFRLSPFGWSRPSFARATCWRGETTSARRCRRESTSHRKYLKNSSSLPALLSVTLVTFSTLAEYAAVLTISPTAGQYRWERWGCSGRGGCFLLCTWMFLCGTKKRCIPSRGEKVVIPLVVEMTYLAWPCFGPRRWRPFATLSFSLAVFLDASRCVPVPGLCPQTPPL